MLLYMFLTGLVFVFIPHVTIPNVDAACLVRPLFPDVCQNVSCPYGAACTSYSVTWCQDRKFGMCFPVPFCGDVNADPCKVAVCPSGTECFNVKDQCSDNGGCTIKTQCEAIKKPGMCPPPPLVGKDICETSCGNDAICPSGMLCCPNEAGTGKFCSGTWVPGPGR